MSKVIEVAKDELLEHVAFFICQNVSVLRFE